MIWMRSSTISGFDRSDLAKPIEPIAVSFAPSTAPEEWSVTVEDVRPADRQSTRNAGRRFREGGR